MAQSVFIYYAIGEDREPDASLAATALIEAVQALSGIRGRLMRRADDATTWMEIYENVADAAQLVATIDACLPASALLACLSGPRHTEIFVPLAPATCA